MPCGDNYPIEKFILTSSNKRDSDSFMAAKAVEIKSKVNHGKVF